MNTAAFSRRGRHHTTRGEENQDAVWTQRTKTVAVAVVCDGAGSFRHGGKAAALVSAAVGKVLATEFEALYTMTGSVARRYLVQKIWTALHDHAAQAGLEEKQLACTLLAAAVDKDGRGLCFHLGDGAALIQLPDGSVEVLSRAENGLSGKSLTYLTMNCDMFAHLRLCKWQRGEGTRLCLMTDGAAAHLLTEEGSWKAENPDWNIKKILAALEERNPMDDFSFALICR